MDAEDLKQLAGRVSEFRELGQPSRADFASLLSDAEWMLAQLTIQKARDSIRKKHLERDPKRRAARRSNSQ